MSHKKKRKDKKGFQHSTISQHQLHGKTLTPPLGKLLPNLHVSSWRDERMPEMLWAALLITQLPRDDALNVFRDVANYIHEHRTSQPPHDVTHEGLSVTSEENRNGILSVLSATPVRRAALRPLLLLRDLPAKDDWLKALGQSQTEHDWTALMGAVACTLDHQSQESTDCRWVRLLCVLVAGQLVVPPDLAKRICYYPNEGDMREVRPSIRASEISLDAPDQSLPRPWASKFWQQCLSDTPCLHFPYEGQTVRVAMGTTPDRVQRVYSQLIQLCNTTRETTTVDARHDAVFGIALYSLSLLKELLRIGASQSISARLVLRTIVESHVTLAYLTTKNSAELWKSYRVFGAGQAKLAYLKLEGSEEKPNYVDIETLSHLANEDMWEEFLQIDLGHWENANLRKLSTDAGVKSDYDQYYPWTSNFAHGHWGALRDTIFETCGNPLHRLHRVPRELARPLPDVIPDACALVDNILAIVSKCFPMLDARVTVES